MGRILFVGDSHSMGFVETDSLRKDTFFGKEKDHIDIMSNFEVWQENNYAEIYAKKHNQPIIVSAFAGCGNHEYLNLIAHFLKQYDDIERVVIQSTYWGRFPIAINPMLDEEILPLDFFLDDKDEHTVEDLIHRYGVKQFQEGPGGWRLSTYAKLMPEHFHMSPLTPIHANNRPDLNNYSYMYIKMYYDLLTHLQSKEYFKTIEMCGLLCERQNIPLSIWRINDRVTLPAETGNYYAKLDNLKVFDMPAIDFIKPYLDDKIENYMVDQEHYNKEIHSLIAEYFIPHILEKT